MKIRISDQSLRIRLTADEALALEKGAFITTSLRFNTIDLFEVELHNWNLTIAEVQSEKNKLIVSMPPDAVRKLVHEPGYLFQYEQENGAETALKLEVEIDLQKAKHT
jgi:hypothetical protein